MEYKALSLSVLFMLIAVCVADDTTVTVSDSCINCICQAASGCNLTSGCSDDVCGPFKITWGYWYDGGQYTVDGIDADADDAYSTCTVDYNCSVLTIRGYMQRYHRDCNTDGAENCYDYMAIHYRGPTGCTQGLPTTYSTVYETCSLGCNN